MHIFSILQIVHNLCLWYLKIRAYFQKFFTGYVFDFAREFFFDFEAFEHENMLFIDPVPNGNVTVKIILLHNALPIS